MSAIVITQRTEQPTAGVRRRVPFAELPAFFARAFEEALAAIRDQGRFPAGPPFGKYYGMPTDTVDVEAGFPVSAPITAAGDVVPGTLPAGSIAEATHVGPYDTLQQTYDELLRHIADAGMTPANVMWESYLSDPATQPDPATWRTQVCWPVE